MLNVKAPSQLYMEGHAGNYALMRIKGDSTVQLALDSRIARESSWKNKSSTVVHCDDLLRNNIDQDRFLIPCPENTFDVESSRKTEIPRAKAAMKNSIEEETLETWNQKVGKLTMQGDFAKLLIEEKENVTWQSWIRNVPRGVLSFALKSSTNTLPTPDNLVRWGKRRLAKCPLCSNHGTLEHILNFCSISLTQGRLTWRHDSVLNHLTRSILQDKPDNIEIFCDLPGFDLNGSTIPPDILVTTSRPDLVIINRAEKKIFLLELTCSFESNSASAHARKMTKYTTLKLDLEDKGYYCMLVPFEVGSRGHIFKQTRLNLMNIFVLNKLKPNVYKLIKEVSKISLLCSFSIFHAFSQPTWQNPPFLEP